MEKTIKITLIILGVLIGIVALDTLYAVVFNSSPLISIRKEYKDGYVSYMNNGLFVNYFYCSNKEEKTVFKGTKFNCPSEAVGNLENDNREEVSERRKKLESLIKNEMISKQFLDKDNLNSYEITRIYVNGYYKDDEEKKYMEITFTASCNDNSKSCVTNCYYDEEDDKYIIWIVTDENTIFELKNGIAISFNDMALEKYIIVGEEIR